MEMIGRPAMIEEPRPQGTRTIVGTITAVLVEGTPERTVAATVKGAVVATKVRGLPMPVEGTGEPVTLTMVPMEHVTLM